MATEGGLSVGVIDIDTEGAPLIERDRLYRLWEEHNWSAKALDFSRDSRDWRERLTDAQRRAILWNYAMFLDGEESVTVTLAPFMGAVRRVEDRIFLSTQIADEARHHVFFDRFLREVCGVGADMSGTLAEMRPSLSWGYTRVFGKLDRVADRLRRAPRSLPALAQGVALYHLVVEGMLAHTGQHYLRDYVTRNELFPGFAEGIQLVARDESRHIAFGVQLLRELVTTRPDCKAAAILLLNRVLPWAAGVFVPPQADWSYLEALGYTPQEVFTFGLRSVETKLRRAGIEPREVRELVKLGCDAPPAHQAARLIALVEGGVVGTSGAPHVSEATMQALFESLRDLAAWTQAQHPREDLTIQWRFDDAEPRYLALTAGQPPRVGVGVQPGARLTLCSTANDWASIANGTLTQAQALVTRRLRIGGEWRLAAQLPRILPS